MKKEEPWYIEQRAEQLAIVYLTRRDDLAIETSHQFDYGLDLWVNVLKDGNFTGRVFGVQVKGRPVIYVSPQDILNKDSIRLDIKDIFIPPDVPFPLCLFVFNMENDEGFYKWLKTPKIDPMDHPKLVIDDTNIFKKLTNEALENIVTEVNRWYENRLQYTEMEKNQ